MQQVCTGRVPLKARPAFIAGYRQREEKPMSETHFPLDESKLSFKIPKDEKPREKIMKLGRKITEKV